MTNTILHISAVTIGIIAIIIAFLIYLKQKKHSNELEEIITETNLIAIDTRGIADRLATESSIRNMTNKIFQLDIPEGAKQRQYKVIYPVSYKKRPMPLIYQGDFYAIHIISYAIGDENLDLREIEADQKVSDNTSVEGDVIFICSPQSNPALHSIYPYAEIIDKEQENLFKKYRLNLPERKNICRNKNALKNWYQKREERFPCWFVTENITEQNDEEKELYKLKKIQIFNNLDASSELGSSLESPAEKDYRDALHGKLHRTHGMVRDYGIFARITHKTGHHIIIAGIHQYGTWIVAHFLRDLIFQKKSLEKDKEDEKKIFYSNDDFITIITGDFHADKLKIDHCGVDGNHLWTRRSSEDPWLRYDMQNQGEKTKAIT